MEKDKIFFGEQGLTTTSANFIANLAKESYTSTERQLSDITLFTTKLKLLSGGEATILNEGLTTTLHFEASLQEIAQLKSLIAWLREAIKAKQRLIKEAEQSSYDNYDMTPPEAPERETTLTADDVIASWGIKQRNRYYYLDTLCATIGKFIHPDGPFSEGRERMYDIMRAPRTTSGSGRDMVLYTKTPSVDVDEVEDTFMHLQTIYREYQAELNSLKHSIETAVQADEAKKTLEYEQKYKEYMRIMSDYSNRLQVLKQEAITKAQALKIIIPDSLKGIFEQVSKLGKKD